MYLEKARNIADRVGWREVIRLYRGRKSAPKCNESISRERASVCVKDDGWTGQSFKTGVCDADMASSVYR